MGMAKLIRNWSTGLAAWAQERELVIPKQVKAQWRIPTT